MKIVLTAGRAHPKHTEGGDFREATFRALRQGLMKADCVLLEPTFDFTLTLPEEYVGRAMTDITNMHGEYDPPEFADGEATISGFCPVYTMHSYAEQIRSYTHGHGKIELNVGEYVPCHNTEQVLAERGYVPELDADVTADSVFCKGGAGYLVPWYEADAKMHTEDPTPKDTVSDEDDSVPERAKAYKYRGSVEEDRELMRIFEATYGKIKPRKVTERKVNAAASTPARRTKAKPKGEDYLIVDGYNLIFAWDELKALADDDLSHARDRLIHLLSNYRGFKKCNVILVFDAYKRNGTQANVEECGGISVVYTKERQTADAYIERTTFSLAEKNAVRVVTSDYVEQLIILGNGATRVSAREFIEEINDTAISIRGFIDP
jgi:predicted RNA-binding protein with PIN domain